LAALFIIILPIPKTGEGLLLAGIYKPRRTRAMNAASGNGAKPNPNIHPSQGNTNIPTTPGNGLPNTATTPGNITTSGNNPGNPATALNPGAVTPGNNIGNQPLNPGNQLANPNNSLTPGQQATTPNSSQTPSLLNSVSKTSILYNNWHYEPHTWNPHFNDQYFKAHTLRHLQTREKLIISWPDPTDKNTSIYRSSYYDEATLTQVTRQIMSDHKAEIDAWLKNSDFDTVIKKPGIRIEGDQLTIYSVNPLQKPIGFGVKRGETLIEDLTDAQLILRKDDQGNFFVQSSYATRPDISSMRKELNKKK